MRGLGPTLPRPPAAAQLEQERKNEKKKKKKERKKERKKEMYFGYIDVYTCAFPWICTVSAFDSVSFGYIDLLVVRVKPAQARDRPTCKQAPMMAVIESKLATCINSA